MSEASTPELAAAAAAREVKEATRAYTTRDDRLAAASLLGSFAAYFVSLWAAIAAAPAWWLVVPLAILNALAAGRLYVLQHDTGHASLFSSRRANDLAGYAISTFTLTPYKAMRMNHNIHHAYLGNLDHRESTEVFTMTLREWQEAGFWKRLGYRIYRSPLFILPFGGLFVYVIRYRWPKNAVKAGVAEIMLSNLAVFAWWGLIFALAGWTGLAIYGLTVVFAGVFGVFLVYLQHNFEDTYWDRKPDLSFDRATLHGSSALDLGWWFDFATANIAYHDIHHFNPAIPSYRLRKCHRDLRERFSMRTIGWGEALRSFTLKLWDEEAERLVPFPRAQRRAGAGEAQPAG